MASKESPGLHPDLGIGRIEAKRREEKDVLLFHRRTAWESLREMEEKSKRQIENLLRLRKPRCSVSRTPHVLPCTLRFLVPARLALATLATGFLIVSKALCLPYHF